MALIALALQYTRKVARDNDRVAITGRERAVGVLVV
jgi:hypothetical protein